MVHMNVHTALRRVKRTILSTLNLATDHEI